MERMETCMMIRVKSKNPPTREMLMGIPYTILRQSSCVVILVSSVPSRGDAMPTTRNRNI